jgi:hypothetical protein
MDKERFMMTTKKVDQTSEPLAAPLASGSEQSTAAQQKLVPRTKKIPRLRIKTGLQAGDVRPWE